MQKLSRVKGLNYETHSWGKGGVKQKSRGILQTRFWKGVKLCKPTPGGRVELCKNPSWWKGVNDAKICLSEGGCPGGRGNNATTFRGNGAEFCKAFLGQLENYASIFSEGKYGIMQTPSWGERGIMQKCR